MQVVYIFEMLLLGWVLGLLVNYLSDVLPFFSVSNTVKRRRLNDGTMMGGMREALQGVNRSTLEAKFSSRFRSRREPINQDFPELARANRHGIRPALQTGEGERCGGSDVRRGSCLGRSKTGSSTSRKRMRESLMRQVG